MIEPSVLRELRTLEDAQQLVSDAKDLMRGRAGRLYRELLIQRLELAEKAAPKPTPPDQYHVRDFADGEAHAYGKAIEMMDDLMTTIAEAFKSLDEERKREARTNQA